MSLNFNLQNYFFEIFMKLILTSLGSIAMVLVPVFFFFKSFYHFQYLRMREGKSATFADYVNIGFSGLKERSKYISTSLPIPINNKLDCLSKKANRMLIYSIVLFGFAIICFTLVLIIS